MRWGWRSRRDAHLPLGQRGERAAARYLKRRGYTILDTNVHLGRYEIDLIVRKGDTVAFVEVRTRADADPVPPEDTVNDVKQRHIRAAARQYLQRHREPGTYYRFDVIGIIMPPRGKPEITHYPNAFQGE